MVIVYVIIGYIISVCIMTIGGVVLTCEKHELENVETIRDYLNLAIEKIDDYDFYCCIIYFPVINTICSIIIILVIILYWFCKITKLNVLWNKILDIRIHKK